MSRFHYTLQVFWLFLNVLITLSLLNTVETGSIGKLEKDSNITLKTRIKRSKSRVYDRNGVASFNLILCCGDVATNPGPGSHVPKCPKSETNVRINQKRLICSACLSTTHLACTNINNIKVQSRTPGQWTCPRCLHYVLPFASCPDLPFHNDNPFSEQSTMSDGTQHETLLNNNYKNLKFLHINTQSLLSSLGEFNVLVQRYNFDIIAMSETWLKDNPTLLQYVQIPEYNLHYNNRDKIKGGGVGCYIKSSLNCKR